MALLALLHGLDCSAGPSSLLVRFAPAWLAAFTTGLGAETTFGKLDSTIVGDNILAGCGFRVSMIGE